MNPLQYTSEEMFSSTELIRKSKMVFDKLHNQDIEKAIILRDGKPSFMLLDFAMYEKLMQEYLLLKSQTGAKKESHVIEKVIEQPRAEEKKEISDIKELNEKDLEEALAQIDELNLETLDDLELENKEKEPLKDFWE